MSEQDAKTPSHLTHEGEPDSKKMRLTRALNPKGEVRNITYKELAKGETLKDKADYIIAFSRPLRFGVKYEKHTNNIQKFINDFFENNKTYSTLYAENKTLACPAGKFRSLIDIFLITRFYFPRISLHTVVKALYKKEGTVVNAQICQGTLRRVYDGRDSRHLRHTDVTDELGYAHRDYVNFSKQDGPSRPVFK